jgi:hypothetical protein
MQSEIRSDRKANGTSSKSVPDLEGGLARGETSCRKCNDNNCLFNGGAAACVYAKGVFVPKEITLGSFDKVKTVKEVRSEFGLKTVNKTPNSKRSFKSKFKTSYEFKNSDNKKKNKNNKNKNSKSYQEHHHKQKLLKDFPHNKENKQTPVVDHAHLQQQDFIEAQAIVYQENDHQVEEEPDFTEFIKTVQLKFDEMKVKKFYFYDHGSGRITKTYLKINKDSIIKTLKVILKGNLIFELFDYLPYYALRSLILAAIKILLKLLLPELSSKYKFIFIIYFALIGLQKFIKNYDSYSNETRGYIQFKQLSYRKTEDHRYSAYDNYKLKHNILFEATVDIVRSDNSYFVNFDKIDLYNINYERFLEMVGPALMDPHLTITQIIDKIRVQNKIVQNVNSDKYDLNYILSKTMIVAEYFCLSNKQTQFDHLDFIQGDGQN